MSNYLVIGNTVITFAPPEYKGLTCPGCGNKENFRENGLIDKVQSFHIDSKNPASEPDFDSFYCDEHFPLEVMCDECGAQVWCTEVRKIETHLNNTVLMETQ